MAIATGLYLVALLLITLFTDVVFGINAQSLAYAPLTLALIVLLYCAMTAERRDFLRRWYTSSPLIAPGLLFLAGLAMALPNAHDVGLAGRDFVRWSFVWLVFMPVTRAVCSSHDRARLCARAVPVFITLFATLTLADLVFGGVVVRTLLGVAGVTSEGRYQSLYQNAGIFAGMLIVGFPLAVVPALTEARRRSRLLWWGAAGVMAGGVLLSGSRAALVATLVAMVVIGVLLRRRWLVALVAGLFLVGAGLLPAGDLGGPPSVARFQDVVTQSGTGHRSFSRRVQIWSEARELLERSPVIGWGGSQLRFHQRLGLNRAHNAWLDAWLDGGLPALLAMVIVTAVILRRAWWTHLARHARWLDPTHVALLAASIAVLTGWTVRAGIGGRIDWLPIFMVCSLWWDLREAPPESEQESSDRRAVSHGV